MNVDFITVVGRQSERFIDLDEAMEAILTDPHLQRVSFGGVTAPGRSGITIHVKEDDERVNGHKIDPIPKNLLPLVTHVSLTAATNGLEQFANGMDVLIGTPEHGILLKWNGPNIEVFGAGNDTESLH